ncbi:hypothetical protein CHRYSEOSP005_32730 [Chryseobacterium sp. Alg-005]|uniref:hypothetical protein n=1 Tax=Chryseobacterium sp. Alg-005 TaxID=3159516 RepID=UPI003555987E
MNKEILKQLKSDYEKLEIKPSADLWDRIGSMDQKTEKGSDLSPKVHVQWWKYAAVVLLLISVGAVVYLNVNSTEKQNTISRAKPAQKRNHLNIFPQNENNENRTSAKELASNPILKTNTDKIITDHPAYPKNTTVPPQYTKPQNADPHNGTTQMAQDNHPVKHNDDIIPEEKPVVENKLVIAEKPEIKSTKYVQASDLLIGREYDKVRGNQETTSYGRIDLSKLKPHFLQVVTLGVTVHSDTK